MSLALATELHHKYRKAIRTVQIHIKGGRTVTTEDLMFTYGWSRTKAHSTLQTMWLLGILNPQNQKADESH